MINALQTASRQASQSPEYQGEVFGGGSEGSECVANIERARTATIRSLRGHLDAIQRPAADVCALGQQVGSLLQVLVNGGLQNDPTSRPEHGHFFAIACAAARVELPLELQRLVAGLRERCTSTVPALELDVPCPIMMDHEYHLRQVETVGSTGIVCAQGTVVQVLAVGTLRRGAERSYRVRLHAGGPEGYVFIDPATVAQYCPHL